MDMRYAPHPEQTKTFTTQEMREHFLIERLFTPGEIEIVYSHIDRIITGGACPAGDPLRLAGDPKTLGAEFFLQRREMGVVNVGGPGQITVDGQRYPMQKLDGLYIGMGSREVCFESSDPGQPAHFYFSSTPAHAAYPTAAYPDQSGHAAASWRSGALQRAHDLQVHPSRRREKLPVGDGRHAARTEQYVEHHAGAYPCPADGSLLLF